MTGSAKSGIGVRRGRGSACPALRFASCRLRCYPAAHGERSNRNMTATTADRGLRLFGRELKPEGVYALVGLATVWQIVSLFVPDYLVSSVPQIATRLVEIISFLQN